MSQCKISPQTHELLEEFGSAAADELGAPPMAVLVLVSSGKSGVYLSDLQPWTFRQRFVLTCNLLLLAFRSLAPYVNSRDSARK